MVKHTNFAERVIIKGTLVVIVIVKLRIFIILEFLLS